MNKTTLMLLLALLTTHHFSVKPGIITNIVGSAVIAVAAVIAYTEYQKAQKSDVEKGIDTVADIAKDGAKKLNDYFKKSN